MAEADIKILTTTEELAQFCSRASTVPYITIDTETSIGGAWRNPAYEPLSLERTVFGQVGSKCYGIPLWPSGMV